VLLPLGAISTATATATATASSTTTTVTFVDLIDHVDFKQGTILNANSQDLRSIMKPATQHKNDSEKVTSDCDEQLLL